VASSKFPMFGSPLRLNASAPALGGSRGIDSARRMGGAAWRNSSSIRHSDWQAPRTPSARPAHA
jgi:hypothetical protein